MTKMKAACTSLLLLGCLAWTAHSVAVMSVDLGAEWIKIAVVTPGVPMEIALNKESKRKTAAAVTLKDGERAFGSDAISMGVKHPKNCYFYLLDLLGKPFDHPQVTQFRQRFPYYEMKAHPERGTVMFQHDAETVYTVEELLGMLLEHAKGISEEYVEQKIKDAVITVPAYFNQAERRALVEAADLAKINVLQLISEPMATALNYGMFRRKEVNATVKHLMFYDMGAQDTTVSIVAFQVIKTKERGFSETHPQAQVIGVGYDRNLGGLEIQMKLRDHLAQKFNDLKKSKNDVTTVPRAMGKLFKEAARVKTVLSANQQIYAQVENVMEDIDFKVEVTRDTLQELNADYFTRVIKPVEDALAASGLTLEEISEVILVGAGTRVPKVQELLTDFLGRELGKNLNTDEASAMGAVYRAADLSTGFKVKKFITKDAVILPIEVEFERVIETDDGETGVKQVKRSLFAKMNPFPQKKIMTFNKNVEDFTFRVGLNDLDHLSQDQIKASGSPNLLEVDVVGVAEAMSKYNEEANVESKGIKAHFSLDDTGLLNVTAVEVIFERTISVEEQEAEEKREEEKAKEASTEEKKEDGSWAESISSFFKESGEEGGDEAAKDGDKKGDKDAKKKEKEEKKKKKEEEKKKKEAEKKKEEEKKKPKKPKIETMKEELKFSVKIVDLPLTSEKLLEESKAKLKALNDFDELKKRKETALNSLESFVIDVKDKLYQEEYEVAATEEEREKIREKASEIGDWIDEEVTPDTEVEVLEAKLKEIKSLTSSWFARVREHTDRPEALAALNSFLNTSQVFLGKAKDKASGDDALFSEKELETLEKKIEEVTKWRDDELEAQEKQPKHEMPKMTTGLIGEKGVELDREVKYLLSKAKIAQAEIDRKQREKEAEAKKAKEAEEKKKKKDKKKKKKKDDVGTEGEEAASSDGEEKVEETTTSEDSATETVEETATPANEESASNDEEEEVIAGGEAEVPEVDEAAESNEDGQETEHTEL